MDESIYTSVTGKALDLNRYAEIVSDPSAGAIATFSGVTRNNFQGKTVLRLEYEAYVPMALKKLDVSGVCHTWEARDRVAASQTCVQVAAVRLRLRAMLPSRKAAA